MLRPSLSRAAHRHGLGGGGGFVEQRGVGDVEAGEVGDHRLEIQQRFEPALGNFGLVRRVLRVPAGIFQDVALDDGRRDAIVIAHADERAADLVLRRDFLQRGKRLVFAARGGQLQRFGQPDRLGHGGIHHGLQARIAEQLEHGGGFLRARADVAADKPVGNSGRIFSQSHPGKLRFASAKSELDLEFACRRGEFHKSPHFQRHSMSQGLAYDSPLRSPASPPGQSGTGRNRNARRAMPPRCRDCRSRAWQTRRRCRVAPRR